MGISKNLSNPDLLNDLDKAKYLLTVLDIQKKTGQAMNDTELARLIEAHQDENDDWKSIKNKLSDILQQD